MKTQNKRKKIKICLVSLFGYSLYNKRSSNSFGGGAAVQLFLLAKEFAKNNDFEISVLTGHYKKVKSQTERFKNIMIFNALDIHKKLINYPKNLIKFFVTLKKINPDIIIQRSADFVTGLCAFFCKVFGKKFIYSIAHELDVSGEYVKDLKRKIFKYGINNATFLVAQSNDQIMFIEKQKNRKINNISVIKSGYKIKEIGENTKKYILWVSRAVRWKRPELFLKLAKLFPKEKFIMICNKEGDILYWESIKKASSISNLKFLNYIPFHKIDRYFKEAKLFINTSIYEGFPNTFIQAFKNKTPVISLNVNPDEILTKNKIGIFCHDDLKKMEFSINQLFENQELYDTYAKNAFTYVKNNHDIKIISKKWFELIEKIIDNH